MNTPENPESGLEHKLPAPLDGPVSGAEHGEPVSPEGADQPPAPEDDNTLDISDKIILGEN